MTSSWYASTSLVIEDSVWKIVSTQLSSGPATSATAKPAMSRVRLSAPPSLGSEKPEPAAACVTMCTSMSPDSRMTVAPMPGPVNAAARRERRLTPMHQLRGIRRPREVDERPRHVLADDLVERAAELLDERALPVEGLGMPGPQAVGIRDVHGEELAARGCAAAIRAPRRRSVSPSGPPVRATTTRSRASHLPVDAVLGAVGLERLCRPRRRATAGRARGGR